MSKIFTWQVAGPNNYTPEYASQALLANRGEQTFALTGSGSLSMNAPGRELRLIANGSGFNWDGPVDIKAGTVSLDLGASSISDVVAQTIGTHGFSVGGGDDNAKLELLKATNVTLAGSVDGTPGQFVVGRNGTVSIRAGDGSLFLPILGKFTITDNGSLEIWADGRAQLMEENVKAPATFEMSGSSTLEFNFGAVDPTRVNFVEVRDTAQAFVSIDSLYMAMYKDTAAFTIASGSPHISLSGSGSNSSWIRASGKLVNFVTSGGNNAGSLTIVGTFGEDPQNLGTLTNAFGVYYLTQNNMILVDGVPVLDGGPVRFDYATKPGMLIISLASASAATPFKWNVNGNNNYTAAYGSQSLVNKDMPMGLAASAKFAMDAPNSQLQMIAGAAKAGSDAPTVDWLGEVRIVAGTTRLDMKSNADFILGNGQVVNVGSGTAQACLHVDAPHNVALHGATAPDGNGFTVADNGTLEITNIGGGLMLDGIINVEGSGRLVLESLASPEQAPSIATAIVNLSGTSYFEVSAAILVADPTNGPLRIRLDGSSRAFVSLMEVNLSNYTDAPLFTVAGIDAFACLSGWNGGNTELTVQPSQLVNFIRGNGTNGSIVELMISQEGSPQTGGTEAAAKALVDNGMVLVDGVAVTDYKNGPVKFDWTGRPGVMTLSLA